MFVFFSKLLPIFIYPLGLAIILMVLAFGFKSKLRLQRASLLLALCILWVAGNAWVSASLTRSLEWQYLPPNELPQAEVLVVLGGGLAPEQYPRSTVEVSGAGDRVIYAAWLYHQGVAAHILVSGGTIPWLAERTTPAEDMTQLLMMLGVPEDAVWQEDQSQNTYENALYSRQFLDSKDIDRILLVTSAMHMPRAVRLFEYQGLEVVPLPTDYSVTEKSWQHLWEPDIANQIINFFPNVNNLQDTTVALKEYLGLLVYRLQGWL
jgi:uncharacterized SAM-binding protein YcdF (DUF218 family)